MNGGEHLEQQCDVLILGGGIAGLTLACQLKRADPDIGILVAEKRKHPVPEAAFKVGESTVQIAARYLVDVVGLGDHLQDQQLNKLGLRFFASSGENRDIAERPELGPRRFAPLPTYQLDRGRLETTLGERARDVGVKVFDATQIGVVELGEGDTAHRATLKRDSDPSLVVSARWLVDASGSAAILRRKLGLELPATHEGNAAWFRIADRIAVDDWSTDPEWQSRVDGGRRWLSTVHLHGRGYWVWLIPLASGSTSVGVVADPEHVPFERLHRFDAVMEWLREAEPQLADEIQQRADLLQDFHTRKNYPRKCSQVFSANRWFITGDAGMFLDPLYSPGLDFISAANSFITRLILHEREGRPNLEETIVGLDARFRGACELAFGNYEGQYGLLGNADTTSAKVTWELMSYFTVPAPMSFASDIVTDLVGVVAKVGPQLARYRALNTAFHTFLRDWDAAAGEGEVGMIAATSEVMDGLQEGVKGLSTEDELVDLIYHNLSLLEAAFRELVERVATVLGFKWPMERDPLDSDEDLLRFRVSDLPRTKPIASALFPASNCGLLWATKNEPGAALSDAWSAWPSLQRTGPLPAPGSADAHVASLQFDFSSPRHAVSNISDSQR